MRYLQFLLHVLIYVSSSFTAPAPQIPIHSAKVFLDPFPSVAIRIGTSPQPLKVLIDTGSSLFWINPAFVHTPSKSTLLTQQQWKVDYAIGNAAGHVASDSIHVGLLNQLELEPDRRFGVADQYVRNGMERSDGIIGLSRYDPSQLTYPGGWDMLSPALSPRIVGLRFQHPRPGAQTSKDTVVGHIDFGGPDPKYACRVTYTKIIKEKAKSAWYIRTHGLHVNGKPSGLGPRVAMLDTGSTGILMPYADAAKVNTLLGGRVVNTKTKAGEYVLPCDLKGSLEIDIENVLFRVPNYLLISSPSKDDRTMCSTWIQGQEGTDWLLGSGFLQAVYSVWDYDGGRVGFASIPPPP